jgi:hypothetical protein
MNNGALTYVEQKTHFALWAMAKAPLFLGFSVSSIPQATLNILLNKNLIAINQDPSSKQIKCAFSCHGTGTEGVSLYGANQHVHDFDRSQRYYAALVVNWHDLYTQGLAVDFRQIENVIDVGFISSDDILCQVFDLWGGARIGTFRNFFNVDAMQPHDSRAYKFKCETAK